MLVSARISSPVGVENGLIVFGDVAGWLCSQATVHPSGVFEKNAQKSGVALQGPFPNSQQRRLARRHPLSLSILIDVDRSLQHPLDFGFKVR